MTTITGITKDFKQMFKTMMCGNKYPLFNDILLEINEETISINSIDQTRAVGTNQKYFGFQIEGEADIPLDTLSIYEAIKLFNDNDILKFIYDDDKIILESNSNNKKEQITIPSQKINEINNRSQIVFTENSIIINGTEMNFDAYIKIDVSHIQNQIRKAAFVNNLYHEYGINIEGTKLILTIGDPTNYEISSSTEIIVEDGFGKAYSTYAHGYDDIFKSLSGEITIYINDEKPMLIVQTNDKYSIKFLVAPTIKE
jgi:hypothetical protein